MHHHLSNTHGIAMQSAFGLYDGTDTGAIAEDQFKLILSIFFSDLLTTEETDFLMQLTVRRNDEKIFYKEFCKFMDKKIVRTFKDVAIRKQRKNQDEVQQEDD
jgi:Ca2+-binding EF-hand superfamily protein